MWSKVHSFTLLVHNLVGLCHGSVLVTSRGGETLSVKPISESSLRRRRLEGGPDEGSSYDVIKNV